MNLLVSSSLLTMPSFRIAAVFLLLALSSCAGERPGTEEVSIYNGEWGDWKGWNGDNTGGYYACGAEMKFEDAVGASDDTAGNGLMLTYCHLDNWYAQSVKEIYAGIWGDWKGMQMCTSGYYVDGGQVRFEGSQGGGDDTALNGLNLRCRNKSGATAWVMVWPGTWGDWITAVTVPNKYAKLANVRFEDSQGGADDTAMNGLQFRYETPNNGVSAAPVIGQWKTLGSAPDIGTTLTESMETTEETETNTEQSASFSASIESGFSFGSVTLSASFSSTTANSVSSTLTIKEERSITVACPDIAESPTGTWFLWQWVMGQPPDAIGPGFSMNSNHYKCTPSIGQDPKCPLGFCADNLCQQCFDWGGPTTSWSSRRASSAPTPVPINPPTPAPTKAPTPRPTNPLTPAPTEAPVPPEKNASPVPTPQLRAPSAPPTRADDQKPPTTIASAAPWNGTTALMMLMVGLLSVVAF